MSIAIRLSVSAFAVAVLVGALPQAAAIAADADVPVVLVHQLQSAQPGHYAVDPDHTRVTWQISHHGFSSFRVLLPKASGSLQLDPVHIENSRVEVVVDMAAAVSGIPVFDQRLADPKWGLLSSSVHPTATFRSTSVRRKDARRFSVTGDLTFLGVTRPITLDAAFNQAGSGLSNPKGYRIGFDATALMDCQLWGLTSRPKGESEVRLDIEAEFMKAD